MMDKMAKVAVTMLVLATLSYWLLDKITEKKWSELPNDLSLCLEPGHVSSQECNKIFETIDSFEQCRDIGLPVMESYPLRCNTPDGRVFVDDIKGSIVEDEKIVLARLDCLKSKNIYEGEVECRYGIIDEFGNWYAVDLANIDTDKIAELKLGDLIEVAGNFIPIEVISSDLGQIYDVRGIIRVNEFTLVE